MLTQFQVGSLYSSAEIQESLEVGNAGGIRVRTGVAGAVRRAVVMTSLPTARQLKENPYHDRIENGILIYTAAGRVGKQTLGGLNSRIAQQLAGDFPVYCFLLTKSRRDKTLGPKRWQFLGLLEYLRHYPDIQIDVHGTQRGVWLFELRVHEQPSVVPIDHDDRLTKQLLAESRAKNPVVVADNEVARDETSSTGVAGLDPLAVEAVRGRLLGLDPRGFEYLVRDLLVGIGFAQVAVTKYSQDGGIDVNAVAAASMWPIYGMLLQVQAKRWLHTVGRKEVAELRGSLQPHAKGAIMTTSYYSRAAISEAAEVGKNPIVLVDGFRLASVVLAQKIAIDSPIYAPKKVP